MSKLDKMFESPFFVKLQEWGGKVQSNKVISAISNGMMSIMSLVIAGAAFMILATLLDIAGVLETTDQVYHWLCVPYNMTMGLISLPIAFAVGYSYSKNLGMKGALANGLVTMVLFLMVAAPVQSVDVNGSATNMIPTSFLGGPGIFVAMFLPIISVRIIKFCKDKNATIKMPDSIPPYLVDSFANIIPLVICLILWQGLSVLCQVAMGGATLPALIMGILGIPLSGLTSIPGMFVLLAISMLCWGLGLHGQGIVSVVTLPAMMAAYGTNAELVAAGQATEFAPIFLFMSATAAGGAGNMLSLAACCLRAKSERLRAVGKAGVVPAIFFHLRADDLRHPGHVQPDHRHPDGPQLPALHGPDLRRLCGGLLPEPLHPHADPAAGRPCDLPVLHGVAEHLHPGALLCGRRGVLLAVRQDVRQAVPRRRAGCQRAGRRVSSRECPSRPAADAVAGRFSKSGPHGPVYERK